MNLKSDTSLEIGDHWTFFFCNNFFQEVGLDQELKLKAGDKMRFSIDEQYRDNGNESVMFIDAALVFSQIKTGSTVIIEDGPLTFVIKEKGVSSIISLRTICIFCM